MEWMNIGKSVESRDERWRKGYTTETNSREFEQPNHVTWIISAGNWPRDRRGPPARIGDYPPNAFSATRKLSTPFFFHGQPTYECRK